MSLVINCFHCSSELRPRQHKLMYGNFRRVQHRKCVRGLSKEEYRRISKRLLTWNCIDCEDITEGMLNKFHDYCYLIPLTDICGGTRLGFIVQIAARMLDKHMVVIHLKYSNGSSLFSRISDMFYLNNVKVKIFCFV